MNTENISKLSLEDARKVVAAHGKFKARSHDTYNNEHLPEVDKRKDERIDIVLIGDSMLERLKTTGTSTKIARLPFTFNAGVGGDKIESVLYRLGTLDMMSKLESHNVKLFVVMVGTNNLKKALKPEEVELYRLLLRVLLRISPPTSKIITCELFKRKDIDDMHVDVSNRLIQGVVKEMNDSLEEERIFWLAAPTSITKNNDLDDHVHLNEKAYAIWDDTMYPRVQELL